ncbi:MAG: hypothetical protein HQK97_03555 [Nitrospirae bacterium]|nr:hypothetical protein [Nitrospirota bacterium]
MSLGRQAKYFLSGVYAQFPVFVPPGVFTLQVVPSDFPVQASMAGCGGILGGAKPPFGPE